MSDRNTHNSTPRKPPVFDTPNFHKLYMPAMPPLGLIRVLRRLFRELAQRRRLRQLLTCDDAQLDDLGYCRHELRRVLRLPLNTDALAAINRVGNRLDSRHGSCADRQCRGHAG
ncbi:hypothetical protein [Salinisphaera aquimarina]|uniref:DUF1127 domain-containing protein n=1 Tax=Salinisphaera aquimarina TaxID=2094031 RepID=A0ABV7ER69_9GAMM